MPWSHHRLAGVRGEGFARAALAPLKATLDRQVFRKGALALLRLDPPSPFGRWTELPEEALLQSDVIGGWLDNLCALIEVPLTLSDGAAPEHGGTTGQLLLDEGLLDSFVLIIHADMPDSVLSVAGRLSALAWARATQLGDHEALRRVETLVQAIGLELTAPRCPGDLPSVDRSEDILAMKLALTEGNEADFQDKLEWYGLRVRTSSRVLTTLNLTEVQAMPRSQDTGAEQGLERGLARRLLECHARGRAPDAAELEPATSSDVQPNKPEQQGEERPIFELIPSGTRTPAGWLN